MIQTPFGIFSGVATPLKTTPEDIRQQRFLEERLLGNPHIYSHCSITTDLVTYVLVTLFLAVCEKGRTTSAEWSVWSCWRLVGHWCGGAACQPPRSHPSSPPLRPEWLLPLCRGSSPGQLLADRATGGVSYGLPNQRARAGHRITQGTHVLYSSGTLCA